MNRKRQPTRTPDVALNIDLRPQQLKLGDVASCAKLDQRRCSHLLNKEVVPLGDQQNVQRGCHRLFSRVEAFDLILAFRLSELRILAGENKRLIHAFHKHFGRIKQGPEDKFFPPRGKFDHRFDWHLVIARGAWMAVLPKEHIPAWLLGAGAPWYSPERGRLERPAGDKLHLGWIQVPLLPIAACVAPVLDDLDLGLSNA